MQLTKTVHGARPHPPGPKLIEQAMAGRHWVAIGAENEDTAKANVGRQVKDGVLIESYCFNRGSPSCGID